MHEENLKRIKKTLIKISPFKYKGWWYESKKMGQEIEKLFMHTCAHICTHTCMYVYIIYIHIFF